MTYVEYINKYNELIKNNPKLTAKEVSSILGISLNQVSKIKVHNSTTKKKPRSITISELIA